MRYKIVLYDRAARTWSSFRGVTDSEADMRNLHRDAVAGAFGRQVYVIRGDSYTAVEAIYQRLVSGDEYTIETLLTHNLERRRRELEGGQGGDANAPFVLWFPPSVRTLGAWAALIGRVQAGAVGGANDGE